MDNSAQTAGTLTDAELDAIEARANAATEPPWTAEGYTIVRNRPRVKLFLAAMTNVAKEGDAAFIAAARVDVPRLVAEVRRLRRMLGERAKE